MNLIFYSSLWNLLTNCGACLNATKGINFLAVYIRTTIFYTSNGIRVKVFVTNRL